MNLGPKSGVALVLLTAAFLRFSFLIPGVWQKPWTPHHFDEHFLPYEALALWEGVAPREIGWPASTSRLLLSGVYAGRLLADVGSDLVRQTDPAAVMQMVAEWSGRRVADAHPLYEIARVSGAIVGVLHVAAMIQAAGRWVGPHAAILAGLFTALAPIAVTHSQLVLADVTGALFATLALGVLPRAWKHAGVPAYLGALVGLATASKFHFGIWLVPSIAAYWVGAAALSMPRTQRLRATAIVIIAFTVTLVALVPWLVINPVLAAKEFMAVVLSKAGTGSSGIGGVAGNLFIASSGLGWLTLLAAVPGSAMLWKRADGLGGIMVGFLAGAMALLGISTIVFDRHGLLVLPAIVLAAAAAFDRGALSIPRAVRYLAIVAMFATGLFQSVVAIEGVGTVNTYHVAHDWIMANLPNGASVVVYSEDNQFLPRTDAQLAQCEVYAHSESAYREKWATNAAMISPGSGMPMRLAVVNDEFFHAFWCARERLTPGKLAFVVHRFHEGRRFQTLNVPTLEREFRAGLTDPGAGFDAVLVHWPLFADLPAAATFQTAVGPTLYAYLRPGLVLRYGAEP